MANIELLEIKQIKGHDVTFLRVFDYVCAYVRIKKNELDENTYPNETLREETFIGIDTAHAWNINMNFKERKEDAERQISELISAL